MYVHYNGGFMFVPPVGRDYKEGTFPPVSQTYKTSGASLMSDISHPISTYRDCLYVGARQAKQG
eukprot:4286901-Ditylum_brightwellii.AAC.1